MTAGQSYGQCLLFPDFRHIIHLGKAAIIVRSKLEHTGHQLDDATHQTVSVLDSELVSYAEMLCDQVLVTILKFSLN